MWKRRECAGRCFDPATEIRRPPGAGAPRTSRRGLGAPAWRAEGTRREWQRGDAAGRRWRPSPVRREGGRPAGGDPRGRGAQPSGKERLALAAAWDFAPEIFPRPGKTRFSFPAPWARSAQREAGFQRLPKAAIRRAGRARQARRPAGADRRAPSRACQQAAAARAGCVSAGRAFPAPLPGSLPAGKGARRPLGPRGLPGCRSPSAGGWVGGGWWGAGG